MMSVSCSSSGNNVQANALHCRALWLNSRLPQSERVAMATQEDNDHFDPGPFPLAVLLALFFVAAQTALSFGTLFVMDALTDVIGYRGTLSDVSMILAEFVFLWAHALFVLIIAGASARKPLATPQLHHVFIASAPLSIIFAVLAWLDNAGAAYSCAEGQVINRAGMPMLPWIWIGWGLLTLFAIPSRLTAWVEGKSQKLAPLWQRALLTLMVSPLIWFFGYVFQVRTIDCTRPMEGWGMFEGGMVMFPLLGLFLFTLSTSLAILSGAFRES
jgi:hypothetical protein